MENTIQKKSHEVIIYGRLYRVETDTMVWPDEWGGATRLQPSEWNGAEFYLPSFRYTNQVRAVNIKVTGRTFQRRPYSDVNWVRVQIEFVGDGEDSTFVSGWWAPAVEGRAW